MLMTSGSLRFNNKASTQFYSLHFMFYFAWTFCELFSRSFFLHSVIYILLDCLCILFLWLGSFSEFHR